MCSKTKDRAVAARRETQSYDATSADWVAGQNADAHLVENGGWTVSDGRSSTY
ncbi:hypothetical protein HUB97_08570 [Halorubraceae archaeon YAN]|nr:hypothetical protein [Halorubraceae archaeon YAN]